MTIRRAVARWTTARLAEVVSVSRPITYGVVQPGERLDQGIPIIRGKDYSSGTVTDEDLYLINPRIAAMYSRSTVKRNDILLSIVGYVGQVAMVPSHLAGANITQTTARISPRDGISAAYLIHYLRSKEFADEVRRYTKGSAQPGLNLADVEKMLVRLPPRLEQRKIAEILDTVDESIRSTKRLIAKHGTVRSSVMLTLLDSTHMTPARELIDNIEAGWSPECLEVTPPKGTWGVLKVSSITSGVFDSSQSKTLPANLRPRPAIAVRSGDVLLCRANGVAELVGITVYVDSTPSRLMLSDKTLRIKPGKNRIIGKYLALALSSPFVRRQVLQLTSGSSGQRNLSQAQILGLRLPWMSLEEQKEVTSTIDAIDSEISCLSQELIKLRDVKEGLMEDLLTGRVRVKVD